jgi:phosphoglycerol transferase MdoB-like AlkP superfamily enzyme
MDDETRKKLLYDDKLLFDNPGLYGEFFRKGNPTLNFVITRSAHLSYKYNEVLSHWGLKQYPAYRGMTGNEETDCAYLKAKLVDDLFDRLLKSLEAEGQLENTVIIGVTDHYTYGYKDMESLYALSGTDKDLLLEKTPCFIWSSDLEHIPVKKTANTADLLPTVLNLLGMESAYDYIGSDIFDSGYEGFVPFSDGSWIADRYAYDAVTEELILLNGEKNDPSEEYLAVMNAKVQEFVAINNLILDTDYYKQ